MEKNMELYRHLFEETLYLVPDPQQRSQRLAAEAAAAEPEEAYSGDTLPRTAYRLLGENRKGLVIAVSMEEAEFQALPGNVFLSKVLAAIQHSPADVAFVNIPRGEKLRIHDLARETKLSSLLAFGPGLLDMTADSKVNLYKPAAIGQVALLIADPLPAVEPDVTKKKLLWSGLQAIFLK
ncbi:MAG: hypothetical protein ACO1NZ_04000 [Adhaeribacter sp.]